MPQTTTAYWEPDPAASNEIHPNVSGNVINVASTTPQNTAWWASQRPGPRRAMNVCRVRLETSARGTSVGKRRKLRKDRKLDHPRRR